MIEGQIVAELNDIDSMTHITIIIIIIQFLSVNDEINNALVQCLFRRSLPISLGQQRQSVGLGIERSRVRNSLVSSDFFFKQENESALLGDPVRWQYSLGRALTTVCQGRPPHSTQV